MIIYNLRQTLTLIRHDSDTHIDESASTVQWKCLIGVDKVNNSTPIRLFNKPSLVVSTAMI